MAIQTPEQKAEKAQAEQHFIAAAKQLNPHTSDDRAAHYFNAAWESGNGARRFYHTPKHYIDVAGEFKPGNNLDALHYITGFHHDIVYHHVDVKDGDHKGFAPHVRETIEQLIDLEIKQDDINVHFKKGLQEPEKSLVTAASQLCGITFNEPLPPEPVALNKWAGQNEYLSALYAIKVGIDLGFAPKDILAEVVMIAGTIPFKQTDRFAPTSEEEACNPTKDSKLTAILDHFCNTHKEYQFNTTELEAIIQHTVDVANDDVANFSLPFKAENLRKEDKPEDVDFISNTYHLLLENVNGASNKDNVDSISPVEMAAATRNMEDYLRNVLLTPNRSVFHTADGSRHECEDLAEKNIENVLDFLRTASTNLQVLLSLRINNDGPPHTAHTWKEIRQNPNVPDIVKASLGKAQTAREFFDILGSDTLCELIAGIQDDAVTLRVKAANMRAETLSNGDFKIGVSSKKNWMNSTFLDGQTQPNAWVNSKEAETNGRILAETARQLYSD